jgi:hypothetical protein
LSNHKFNGNEKRIKKNGVPAVLLAGSIVFSENQELMAQRTIPIDVSENPTQDKRVWVDIQIGWYNFYGCRSTGGNCMPDITVKP